MASTPAGLPRPIAARPRELEDWLNRYLYHPLARGLARLLVPTGIGPNAVSIAGMLLVWGAAAAYVGLSWPLSFLIGFTLHLLWHVFDGADGDLARLTGRSSPTGELVDGVCDYAGHVLLYFALAFLLLGQIGAWAWALALAAGVSHAAQTNHAETQRRHYLWWVYGVPWLKHAKAEGDEVFQGRDWFSRTFGWMARDYLKVAGAMTPFASVVDRAVEEARGDPAVRQRMAEQARASMRRALTFQKLLGPNPRTIILGISMGFGTPLYFLFAEVVLLNLLLAWSIKHHNAVERRLAETLEHARR